MRHRLPKVTKVDREARAASRRGRFLAEFALSNNLILKRVKSAQKCNSKSNCAHQTMAVASQSTMTTKWQQQTAIV